VLKGLNKKNLLAMLNKRLKQMNLDKAKKELEEKA
jgi:hypothetical protein